MTKNNERKTAKMDHPTLREVIFQDISNGSTFKILSSAEAPERTIWSDGKEYPLVKVEISSASHPAFLPEGKAKRAEPPPRAEAFRKKYGKADPERLH